MEDYEKVKVVGRGAFGTVYLCRRRRDGREVIIKQIPVEQLSAVDRQAALNEVRVLAMLHHPNVIEYYDNFVADKAMAIVMEYAAGGNLFDFIEVRAKEERYLPEEEIAHLFAQIVLPIQLVHSRQVLHRDLKTQNIFLTKTQDHVKVGDFGISKILSSKSKAYSVVGTPCYISPELCEGKAYNQKSDVWALGCVLYEMCALRRAFEAPTLPALVLKIMRGSYQPLPAHYSQGLREMVSMLLALDPGDRPTLPQAMAHPWLAPHLYRIPTTLGALPCTARPPRPLSVTTPDDFNLSPLMQRRSVSPFQRAPESVVLLWRGAPAASEPARLSLPKTCTRVKSVCAAGEGRVVAATADGRPVEWTAAGRWSPRFVEGLGGITIVEVVARGTVEKGKKGTAADESFCCLLTDRGILLTYGAGAGGCLGHGDAKPVDKPKIVEELLGDEVTKVACGPRHVVALTSEGELFGWGRSSCLGLGAGEAERKKVTYLPARICLEDASPGEQVADLVCGWEGTVLRTESGKLLVAGRNEAGRFGLSGATSNSQGPKDSGSDGMKLGSFVEAGWKGGPFLRGELPGKRFMAVLNRNWEAFIFGSPEGDTKSTWLGDDVEEMAAGRDGLALKRRDGAIVWVGISEGGRKLGEAREVKAGKFGSEERECGGLEVAAEGAAVLALFE